MAASDNDDASEAATAAAEATKNPPLSSSTLRVTFVHLDLGIGGAEQLVLQLALATLPLTSSVQIVTTRCDPSHSFQEFKAPNGILYQNVKIVGRWIPPTILGYGTAFCSSLRMLYLSLYVIWNAFWNDGPHDDDPNVVVLDVLPTSIPLLRYCLPRSGILFYCHFPDKLLTRDTVNGEVVDATRQPSLLARLYRGVINAMEEYTLNAAHVICVNSNFTKTTVQRVFGSLKERDMDVLYPAILGPTTNNNDDQPEEELQTKSISSPIVSLNRFERKKNVELLLYAYAELRHQLPPTTTKIPTVIIAGGYDPKNVENIEYMGELRRLTSDLDLEQHVEFCPSISDQRRRQLLQTALCVVYTPHLEHFGIVPLESMLAGTPVICVKSGGPLETVVDGVTGFLCDPTPRAFGQALQKLVEQPELATKMGRSATTHVKTKFGMDRLGREWEVLLRKTVLMVTQNQQVQGRRYSVWNSARYLWEAILMLAIGLLLTWLLKVTGWMDPHESILGKMRRTLWADEL